MINKRIFYLWCGSSKPIDVEACVLSWRQNLPDYEIVEIKEDDTTWFDFNKACAENEFFNFVYKNKIWAYVADYIRFYVLEKFGYECSYYPHHNLDVYNKTAFKRCNEMCAELVEQTSNNRFRTAQDWQRVLISYYMLATGSGKLKIINAYKMSWLQWLKHNLLDFGKKDSLILPLNFKTKKYYNKLHRYKPKFLCMEDNEHSNDDDRARGKAFLQSLFPDKSEFEN